MEYHDKFILKSQGQSSIGDESEVAADMGSRKTGTHDFTCE
jgi:hypothetical protein